MKKLYWRPQRISLSVLWLVALVAVVGLIAVETLRVREKQPYYAQKMRASRLALRAFDAVKEERLKRRISIDPEADPSQSGLIGVLLSPVTTNPGHLPAKKTSIDPNFAGAVVNLLRLAGVEEGDVVAVGLSGSFPAINISVMAAAQTLKLKAMVISSAGASQWGANIPELLWPDMEKALYDKRILQFRSLALSRGGIDDRALGLTKQGRELLDAAIARSGLPQLKVVNYEDSVEKRLALYMENAGDAEIKAYVNVGGVTTSVGTRVGKKLFKPGLNRFMPRGASVVDSVMTRFAADGVPVIHLSKIDQLALRYGFPLQPTSMPAVGEGKIFFREVPNRWLAVGVLAAIFLMLFGLVRLDWGYLLFNVGRRDK